MKSTASKTVEALELFHFAGERRPRLAWVTWRIGGGERCCVSVREIDTTAKG